MKRPAVVVSLALAAILCAVLISGCNNGVPASNNTASSPSSLPAAQRANAALADTIPAYGLVRLDSHNITGANVIAIAVDGTDSVSTVTNGSGAYLLNLKKRTWYRVAAAYQGLRHTIFPVYMSRVTDDLLVINLSRTQQSTITGSVLPSSRENGSDLHIVAVAPNSSEPLVAVTDDDGRFSLDVEPGIYYYLDGDKRYNNDIYQVGFYYYNGAWCHKIRLGQDETALIDYTVWNYSGVTTMSTVAASPSFMPQASGYVYIEDRACSGAAIEAVSLDGADRVNATTDPNGFYRLDLVSSVPYRITARYTGLQHTVWPILLNAWDRNHLDRYDIDLTYVPGSTIAGYAYPHYMDITATPANGTPVAATTSFTDEKYSLDVIPDVPYQMDAKDHYQGEGYIQFFSYPPGQPAYEVGELIVHRNETLLVNFNGMFRHQ